MLLFYFTVNVEINYSQRTAYSGVGVTIAQQLCCRHCSNRERRGDGQGRIYRKRRRLQKPFSPIRRVPVFQRFITNSYQKPRNM